MRVLENNEWKKEVRCGACNSLLELRHSDLQAGNVSEYSIVWKCCVCDHENRFPPSDLPPGYPVIRADAPQGHLAGGVMNQLNERARYRQSLERHGEGRDPSSIYY